MGNDELGVIYCIGITNIIILTSLKNPYNSPLLITSYIEKSSRDLFNELDLYF